MAEERDTLTKTLDGLMQSIGDIRIALSLRIALDESGGVTELAIFTNGGNITTTLSADDLKAIDDKIAQFVDEFKARAKELKYKP